VPPIVSPKDPPLPPFGALPPAEPTPPEAPPVTAPSKTGDDFFEKEIKFSLGRKIATINALDSNQRATTAALLGQDFPAPRAGDSTGVILGQAQDFINEIKGDYEDMSAMRAENDRLTADYSDSAKKLNRIQEISGLGQSEVDGFAASEKGQLSTAATNLEKSTTMLADRVAAYNTKVESTALGFMDAWKATKKNEAKKNDILAATVVLDLVSGLGVGLNAITQLGTKEIKGGINKLSDATNNIGLRGGQIIDMVQAGLNSGVNASNIKGAGNMPEVLSQLTDGENKIGTNLSTLRTMIQAYVDEAEASKYEGIFGF
jgi:hypothetical protein